ncbi:MAG: hypothetical protein PHU23_00095 [Dehalococcoidales bacterium]|nr:hypothetical protein [Dehalococcoidales bacterium]
MAKFAPSPYRDEAMQFLREGIQAGKDVKELKEECVAKFQAPMRTVEYWIKQITNPAPPKPPKISKASKASENTQQSGFTTIPSNQIPEQTKSPTAPDQTTSTTTVPSQSPAKNVIPPRQTVLDVVGPTFVNFRFFNDFVPVNTAYLENAYGYYKKMKALEPDIEESFEDTFILAMNHIYKHIRDRLTKQVVALIEEKANG